MRNFKRSYNKRDVLKMLKKNGYSLVRQSGSHSIFENHKGDHLTVKLSSFNPMIFQRLVKENNLII